MTIAIVCGVFKQLDMRANDEMTKSIPARYTISLCIFCQQTNRPISHAPNLISWSQKHAHCTYSIHDIRYSVWWWIISSRSRQISLTFEYLFRSTDMRVFRFSWLGEIWNIVGNYNYLHNIFHELVSVEALIWCFNVNSLSLDFKLNHVASNSTVRSTTMHTTPQIPQCILTLKIALKKCASSSGDTSIPKPWGEFWTDFIFRSK